MAARAGVIRGRGQAPPLHEGRILNVGTYEDPILVTLDGTVLYARRKNPLVPRVTPGVAPEVAPGAAPGGPAAPDPNSKSRQKPP